MNVSSRLVISNTTVSRDGDYTCRAMQTIPIGQVFTSTAVQTVNITGMFFSYRVSCWLAFSVYGTECSFELLNSDYLLISGIPYVLCILEVYGLYGP